jgi:acylphosphatase
MEALRLGLSGSARNSDDGSVYVEAEGAADAVNSFLGWLRHGPPGARVDDVVTEPEPLPLAGTDDFQIG